MKSTGLLLRLALLAALLTTTLTNARGAGDVEKARSSVVRILCVFHAPDAHRAPTWMMNRQRRLIGLGSGFVIAENGLIGTNNHVADMADGEYEQAVKQGILVPELYAARVTPEGVVEILPAVVEWKDAGLDLALIRARDLSAPVLKMNIGELSLEDTVYAIGFPGAADSSEDRQAVDAWLAAGRPPKTVSPPEALRRFLTSSSNKSSLRRVVTDKWKNHISGAADGPAVEMIENDCQFSPGNSGGPLFNTAGEVIGVNTAGGPHFRISSRITELHRVMQARGWSHKYTSSRPSTTPWLMISAIAGATLIGLTGAVMAMRRRHPELGRTTLLRILGPTGRKRAPGRPEHGDPARLGPLPESTMLDPRARTVLARGAERAGLEDAEPERHYETFRLAPSERDGEPIDLEGRRFARQNGRLIVGRSSDLAQVCVEDRNISNRHAAVRVKGTQLYIEDLESSNGTRVNGKRLEPFTDTPIAVGDIISLGSLRFELLSLQAARGR